MPEARTKTVTVKADDDTRSVTARFATLNVIDHDGDMIMPGAIGEQSVFMGAYNHDWAMLPPGMGATYETDSEALFRGEFFDTWSGDEHYKTIKAAGGQMDWSFRFFVEDGGWETRDSEEFYAIRKARVTHVAPVESGAGINTTTLEVKNCGPECQANKAGQQGDAREKGSVGIDYSRLAEALGPIVVSAMESGVGKVNQAAADCSCGGKSTGDDATYQKGTLFLQGHGQIDIDTSTAEGRARLTSRLQSGMGLIEAVMEIAEEDAGKAGGGSTAAKGDDPGAGADPEPPTPSGSGDTPPTGGDAGTPDPTGSTPSAKGQKLGDLLRQLRDEKELTNDDLAEAAGLSVSSIGGILAGTTTCPKIGQLQGLARRMGVNLSRLVMAMEEDGCDQHDDSTASADDQGATKNDGDTPQQADPPNNPEPSEPEPSGDVLKQQVDAILLGFPGLPPEIDPAVAAYGRYQEKVLKEGA